jgi:myo-inositol-1(or 4)-monophosphatase
LSNTHQKTDLIEFSKNLAEEAGKAILPLFRTALNIESKPSHDWDPVTDADRKAEAVIRKLIEATFPDDEILGEEYGEKPGKSGYKWILDPIDGTRAFVAGMPTWATLIGLYRDEAPVLGVMHQPFLNEMFFGNGQQAWYERGGHKQILTVSKCKDLSEARLGTTSPHLYETFGMAAGFDTLRNKCKLTRYSGDAYYFCMVAAGHLDIALDPQLQPYDIAALIPIIRGAGGTVVEWTGKDPANGGNVLAAANPTLAEQAVEALNSL